MSTNNRLTANLLMLLASLLAPFVTFFVPIIAQISHKQSYMLILDLTILVASIVIAVLIARKFNKYQARGLVYICNTMAILLFIVAPSDGGWRPLLDTGHRLTLDLNAITSKEIYAFLFIAIWPVVACYLVLSAKAGSIIWSSEDKESLFNREARGKQAQFGLCGVGLYSFVMIYFGDYFGISLSRALENVILIGILMPLFVLPAYEIFRREYREYEAHLNALPEAPNLAKF